MFKWLTGDGPARVVARHALTVVVAIAVPLLVEAQLLGADVAACLAGGRPLSGW